MLWDGVLKFAKEFDGGCDYSNDNGEFREIPEYIWTVCFSAMLYTLYGIDSFDGLTEEDMEVVRRIWLLYKDNMLLKSKYMALTTSEIIWDIEVRHTILALFVNGLLEGSEVESYEVLH